MKRVLNILWILLIPAISIAQPAISYQLKNTQTTYHLLPLSEEIILCENLNGKNLNAKFLTNDGVINPIGKKVEAIKCFTFNFGGEQVNSFGIYTNGGILLGKDSVLPPASLSFSNSQIKNLIYCRIGSQAATSTVFGDALIEASLENAVNGKTKISYTLKEKDEDSVLTIQFQNVYAFLPKVKNLAGANLADTLYAQNFQIEIRQKTGEIKYHFDLAQPSVHQSMVYTFGLFKTSQDKRVIDFPFKSTSWTEAIYNSVAERKLPLNDSIFPQQGFAYHLTVPSPCSPPKDTLLDYTEKKNTSNSFEVNFKGNSDAYGMLCIMTTQENLSVQPTDGKLYTLKDSIEGHKIIMFRENINSTTPLAVTQENLESDKNYYLHSFPYSYLCIGGPIYGDAIVKTIRTRPGAPALTLSDVGKGYIDIYAETFPNAKILLTRSSREWDSAVPVQPDKKYKIGDNIIPQYVGIYPPIEVIYIGENSTKFRDSNTIQAGGKYFYQAWSFLEDTVCKYSSLSAKLNQLGVPLSPPCILDFKYNAISKYTAATLPSLPIGWIRSWTDSSNPRNNFSTGAWHPAMNRPAQDIHKRLFVNFAKANIGGISADAVSPAILVDRSGLHKIDYTCKFGTISGIDVQYVLKAGDTLRVQYKRNASPWEMMDIVTVADTLNKADEFGYSERTAFFEATKGDTLQIRYIFSSNHSCMFALKQMNVEPVLPCSYTSEIAIQEALTSDTRIALAWKDTNSTTQKSYLIRYIQKDLEEKNTWSTPLSSNNNKVEVSSLDPFTEYLFQVKTVCGLSDTSLWSKPSESFMTFHSMPFLENFDAWKSFPQESLFGWKLKSGLLTDTAKVVFTETPAFAGWDIRNAVFPKAQTDLALFISCKNHKAWTLLPKIKLWEYPLKTSLKFDLTLYKYQSGSNLIDSIMRGNCRLVALISTDEGLSYDTSCILKQWSPNPKDEALKDLKNTKVEIDLSSYTGVLSIAFYWENIDKANGSNILDNHYIYIDDLKIDYTEEKPCEPVSDVTIKKLLPTELSLGWKGKAQEYAILIKKQTDSQFDTLYTDQKSILIDSLLPETAYHFTIQSYCNPNRVAVAPPIALQEIATPSLPCPEVSNFNILDVKDNLVRFSSQSQALEVYAEMYPTNKPSEKQFFSFTMDTNEITELKPETNYTLRLRSICKAGDSSRWAVAKTFTTLRFIDCVIPSDLTAHVIDSANVRLEWTGSEESMKYTLYYKNATQSDYLVIDEIFDPSYLLSKLKANTTYDCRVQAVCENNILSDTSLKVSFTTQAVSIENVEKINNQDFIIFADKQSIEIRNLKQHFVKKAEIYSIIGKRIQLHPLFTKDDISLPRVNENFVLLKLYTDTDTFIYKIVLF